MRRILFLCTGNSARSILGEAIANGRFGDRLSAASAGSTPKGTPNPLAIETLRRHAVPVDALRSERWDRYLGETFDLVLTLCDSARDEGCPVFPGGPPHVHWSLPDPPAADDPASMFERVFAFLDEAIGELADAADDDLADVAHRIADEVDTRIGRTA